MAETTQIPSAAAAGAAPAAPAAANGTSGGRYFRPHLCRKLFRLKNLGEVQDTEENSDDSELKVRNVTLINAGQHFQWTIINGAICPRSRT